MYIIYVYVINRQGNVQSAPRCFYLHLQSHAASWEFSQGSRALRTERIAAAAPCHTVWISHESKLHFFNMYNTWIMDICIVSWCLRTSCLNYPVFFNGQSKVPGFRLVVQELKVGPRQQGLQLRWSAADAPVALIAQGRVPDITKRLLYLFSVSNGESCFWHHAFHVEIS